MKSDAPAEVLVFQGITIRREPPIPVYWCSVPISGRAKEVCGYRTQACEGDGKRCDACFYSYCERHFPSHRRRLYVPPKVWRSFKSHLYSQLAKVAEDRKKRVRLPWEEVVGAE